MLVISRKEHERIWLILPDGRRILLEIVAIDRGKVKLGIAAPDDVRIWRNELMQRVGAGPVDGGME